MSGQTLTTASTLQCPHGGTVQIVSSNTSVKADEVALALAADTFTISGCPFQIPAAPSPIPSPCVTVQWLKTDLKTTVNGTPTLSTTSVGLCLAATQVPQGSVIIANTQTRVSSL
jgi:hypothetical protein